MPPTPGYTPLTPQQYQSARSAGFTPEKIIQMEQTRKAQYPSGTGGGTSSAPPPVPNIGVASGTSRNTLPITNSENPLNKALVNTVPGAKAIGESLGTAALNIGKLAQGQNPDIPVNVPRAIGGYLKAGSTVASLGATPATLGGTALGGAVVGGAQGGGGALEDNASAGDVLKRTGQGALLGSATASGVYGLGKLMGAVGDKIQTSVIKPSRADIADGFSLDTIKKYDLGGNLNTTAEKTQSKLSDLTTQLRQKLAASDATVDLKGVFDQTVSELTGGSKLKGFGANGKILNMISQLKDEIGTVAENGTLSVPDSQIIKQAAGNFGAWQYGKVDPESKASEIVYNTFYNKLKTAIEDASPEGVKDINAELGKLIPIQNAVLRRMPVAERAGLISLNDMIGLVGTSMHPAALGPTLLNLMSKSGTAGRAISKLAPKVGRLAVPSAAAGAAIGVPAGQ